MAISKSLFTRGLNQRVGGAVFYQQAGRTLVRELAAEVSNPRTISQMTQRVKWSNLVAFYKANKGWMSKAFENKKATQSDYNRFMSLNSSTARIAFTKQEAQSGACVVDSYRITDGSLPPVEITTADYGWDTNLYVGDGFIGTTVADLSAALLEHNTTLRLGDQISFIRETQRVVNHSGIPYLSVKAYEMRLDTTNLSNWGAYLPEDVVSATAGQLSVQNNEESGAFAFVVSRTEGGKTLVSPQFLTLVNMDLFINTYSDKNAFNNAILSYGTSKDIFLDSNRALTSKGKEEALSIIGVRVVDTDEFIRANETFRITTYNADSVTEIHFNEKPDSVQDPQVHYVMTDGREGSVTTTGALSGSIYTINRPGGAISVGAKISRIYVFVNGEGQEIVFNTQSGGDLE